MFCLSVLIHTDKQEKIVSKWTGDRDMKVCMSVNHRTPGNYRTWLEFLHVIITVTLVKIVSLPVSSWPPAWVRDGLIWFEFQITSLQTCWGIQSLGFMLHITQDQTCRRHKCQACKARTYFTIIPSYLWCQGVSGTHPNALMTVWVKKSFLKCHVKTYMSCLSTKTMKVDTMKRLNHHRPTLLMSEESGVAFQSCFFFICIGKHYRVGTWY